MSQIRLSNGDIALCDPEDVEALSAFTWHLDDHQPKHRYAYTRPRVGGTRRRIFMHRLVMQAPDGMPVDHISGDGLDNRRAQTSP